MASSTPLQRAPAAERVGTLLGSDLAGRVVESFDFCSIASQVASCVSHRWNTLAVQQRELLHDVFWDEPGPQDWLAAFERLDEWNGDGPERIHSEEAATAAALISDPVAARLRRLGPSRGAFIVDAGETIAASFVAYAEALPANGFKHRVLIVARDEDLGKWTAAFSGKEYYRGDFDASPNFAEYNYEEAEPLNVYVCSEQCMRRHWDAFSTINSDPNQQSRSRFVFVVDAGAENANTMMPLVSLELNKLCSSGYVVSKPLPPQGLDFEEAIFRLHWANALMADLIVEPLLRRGEGPPPPGVLHPPAEPLLRCVTTDRRTGYLREVIRRDISERLVSEYYAITVPVVEGP